MTEPADVQAVVDRLAATVGQSVLVEDLDQHPVWWGTQGSVDPARRRAILDRRVEPLAAAVVERFRLRQATAPVRTPPIPEADMWARWCVPVRFGDRLLGLLGVLDPDETIGDDTTARPGPRPWRACGWSTRRSCLASSPGTSTRPS